MRIAIAMLLSVALAACGGRDRATNEVDVPPAAAENVAGSTLPTPDAAPGTSVTGMPTSPPAAPTVADASEAAPQAPDTAAPTEPAAQDATLPAPVPDTTAASTTSEPPAPSAGPAAASAPATTSIAAAPVDAGAAGSIVTQYFASLSAGAFAKAQGLWSTTPNDSLVLQLARGTAFNVSIGAPLADAAGHVAVPVDIRGKADDGSDRHVLATYSLQRAPNGGAWRIQSAAVRESTP